MVNSINNFYSDIQPIVSGILEYRALLNSEDISSNVREVREKYEAWTDEFNDAISVAKQPRELKRLELQELSKTLWENILNNLKLWFYGKLNPQTKQIIQNRIVKNLINWDFVAIDFVVDSMKNPLQYILSEKEPSNPYWNN